MKLYRAYMGLATAVALSGAAQATTFTTTLTGDPSQFSENTFQYQGQTFQQYSLELSGLDSSNAFTVSDGDSIDSSVTFSNAYTIPASQARTDILQFFSGSSFPNENTGVTGEFNFYDGAALVRTFDYESSTSGQLASFAAVFPPNNTAFTFDSFTNDLTITDLATPATIDNSSFTYDLVSSSGAVPEPATWLLMIAGLGGLGLMLRREKSCWAVENASSNA